MRRPSVPLPPAAEVLRSGEHTALWDAARPGLSLLAGPRNVTPYIAKRGEQYMNGVQLDHFRNILNGWKRDLMEEVDRTVSHMKDEAANFPDPNDRATQEEEFSLELRTRDRERKLIRKIEFTVIGNAVNLAQRLEATAGRGQVFVGQGTFDEISGRALAFRMPEASVKNVDAPISIYSIRGLVPPSTTGKRNTSRFFRISRQPTPECTFAK